MSIKTKRIYEKTESDDGYRLLADRLWPRGISKEGAALDEWCKEIAPSTELRKWFNHQPELFDEFEMRYREEISDKTDILLRLKEISRQQRLTLLFGAKEEHYNHTQILEKILLEME